MTAKEALDAANDAESGERLRRFESRCGPRGSCRREPCEGDAGRWTFCPDCLTVFDDYGKAVNPIPEFRTALTAVCGVRPKTYPVIDAG